jgi:hypothetical protein
MKKIVFVLIFLFSAAVSYSQSKLDYAADYIPWKISNPGCDGCASFYWRVSKQVLSDGTFSFDVWFYSNSFYQSTQTNNHAAATYVHNMRLIVDGVVQRTSQWMLFKSPEKNPQLNYVTTNPMPNISLEWDGLKIY